MLIVLMGWLYVVLMFAVAQNTLLATLSILFFLGFLPTCYLARRARRQLQRRRDRRDET
ncbi:hypothetical protein HZU77_011355 [Neisseriaceae bacterium TC5R-5]|nr:hypothetical protein [Neisseriaceae bacterium TC5R-5]